MLFVASFWKTMRDFAMVTTKLGNTHLLRNPVLPATVADRGDAVLGAPAPVLRKGEGVQTSASCRVILLAQGDWGMRVLVADDDRIVVTLVAGMLRAKGHQVTPVFDAMQAFMFAMRPPAPDVIILDINMPGGTGIEAIKRLKSSHNTALIPVIVLSGTTDPQMPEKVKSLGADAFLKKPVDSAALFTALAKLLPGS